MPLKATLVLRGGSLVHKDIQSDIEIEAHALNLSSSGVLLSLDIRTHWGNIAPHKNVELILEHGHGKDRQPLDGQIVRMSPGGRLLGLQFTKPLANVASFLVPNELQ